jgi:acetylornithine/succinyldiaminopimelate/putrescine aminotransferase
MNNRQLFQQYVAQTSPAPVGLEIVSAKGNYLYDTTGRACLDMIGGISVCNIGHSHPAVVEAIRRQSEQYLHIMVYGELVQSPQVQYAKLLAEQLPAGLDNVYFTNSGSEATEGAIKLARRYTGRTDIIACNKSYHGNTMGALSIMGDEYWRAAFRPLLPGVWHYDFNSSELIDAINSKTACVVLETIQGEAGAVSPDAGWLKAVRQKCTETGALLVLDEIQCGFGRTGTLWAFEQFGVIPDILLLGKALGGGMPMGAFIAARKVMNVLTYQPVLGHITTFGGHPLCCAAGMAAFGVLLQEKMMDGVQQKEALFHQLLVHKYISGISSRGLLMAVHLSSEVNVQQVLALCLQQGIFSDWFLFAPNSIRIAPPLTITATEIEHACSVILDVLNNC